MSGSNLKQELELAIERQKVKTRNSWKLQRLQRKIATAVLTEQLLRREMSGQALRAAGWFLAAALLATPVGVTLVGFHNDYAVIAFGVAAVTAIAALVMLMVSVWLRRKEVLLSVIDEDDEKPS